MKAFVVTAILALFLLAPWGTNAGGGDFPPQQQIAPPQVVIVPPGTEDDSGWIVPVVVAALGATGVVGAAYVGRRKGN